MENKKIILIWYDYSYLKNVGGIEMYINNFLLFSKLNNYYVDVFLLNNTKKINFNLKIKSNNIIYFFTKPFEILINKLFRFFWLARNNKKIEKKIKKEKYDFIFNHTWIKLSNKIIKNSKFFQVQHFDYEYYERSFIPKLLNYNIIYKLAFYILNDKLLRKNNLLYISKNLICFSENKKYLEINKCSYSINVPIKDIFFNYNNKKIYTKKSNFCYIGRLNEDQKNISLIYKIFSKLDISIDVYGDGKDKKILENKKNVNLKGSILNNEIPELIPNKYNFFILTSNTEGCPTIALELMSIGLIGIIRNSFLEAKTIIPEKYHNMLLTKKKSSEKDFINKIKNITSLSEKELNEIRNNLISHVKENYSFEKFSKSWEELIERKKIN